MNKSLEYYQSTLDEVCREYHLPLINVRWNEDLEGEKYKSVIPARTYFIHTAPSLSWIELNPMTYKRCGIVHMRKFLLHEAAHYIHMTRYNIPAQLKKQSIQHGARFLSLCDELGGIVGYYQMPEHLRSKYEHLITTKG